MVLAFPTDARVRLIGILIEGDLVAPTPGYPGTVTVGIPTHGFGTRGSRSVDYHHNCKIRFINCRDADARG